MSQLKADLTTCTCQTDQGMGIRQSGFHTVKWVRHCSSMVMLTKDYWFKRLAIDKQQIWYHSMREVSMHRAYLTRAYPYPPTGRHQ